MTLEELCSRYFQSLDSGDGRTLRDSLCEALGTFLADLADNADFPSERSLAQALHVHRNTLRSALQPYIESGQLRRTSRRTLVYHRATRKDSPHFTHVSLNPLQLQSLSLVPIHQHETLTVLTYETLPEQRLYWQQTIAAFQETHPGIRLTIKEPTCFSFDNYYKQIVEEQPDVFQLPSPFAAFSHVYQELLSTLPEDFFPDKEFLCELYRAQPEVLRKICPLGASLWIDLVNRNLADQYQVDLMDFNRGGALDHVVRTGLRLPKGIFLSSHINALYNSLGIPQEICPQSIHENSLIIFRLADAMASRFDDLLVQKPSQPFFWFKEANTEAFLQGRLLHLNGVPPILLKTLEQHCPFPVLHSIGHVSEPARKAMPLTAVSMGIHAQSAHYEPALEFLQHLLSPQEQLKSMNQLWWLPFRRDAAERHPLNTENCPLDWAGFNVYSPDLYNLDFTYGKDIPSVLAGTMTPEEAANRHTERFFADYSARKRTIC